MTFAELPAYTKRVHDLLDEDAELDFFVRLLKCPGEGSVIPGAGGLRKIRVAAKGHGKRGGARVIYYWQNAAGVIWLCRIYMARRSRNQRQPRKPRNTRKGFGLQRLPCVRCLPWCRIFSASGEVGR